MCLYDSFRFASRRATNSRMKNAGTNTSQLNAAMKHMNRMNPISSETGSFDGSMPARMHRCTYSSMVLLTCLLNR